MVGRRSTTVAALFLTVALAGCATLPVLHGGGNIERWQADVSACNGETVAFAFIPDYGITRQFHGFKCMKKRGWVATRDGGWAWTGTGATLEFARFADGVEQLVLLCPTDMTCQTVTLVAEPAEGDVWTYVAWPNEVSRRVDVLIVGGSEACEQIRQQDATKGVSVTVSCQGPRYFKRLQNPSAAR